MTPVAQFLVDFGSKPAPEVVTDELLVPLVPSISEAEIAERVDEAHARGIEDGRRAAEEEAGVRLEEQALATQHEIAAARASWIDETAPQIAAEIGSAIEAMEDRIAAAVERALRPFLAQAARDEALRQLRATIAGLIATSPGITIEVSGPEDLLDAVRASLPASAAAASFVAKDTADIQIRAGTSLIETRIAAWMQTCEGQAA